MPVASKAASSVSRAAVAPTGTLYTAATAVAYAYPLDASGSTSPLRTITPHVNQTNHIIAGLATNADGTLDILERLFITPPNTNTQTEYCRVVVEPADANGSPAASNVNCDAQGHSAQASGITRNISGGYDVLYFDRITNTDKVQRFGNDGSTLVNTLVLNFFPLYIGSDRGGHDYLDTAQGRIVNFRAATTDTTMPASDVTIAGNPALGPIAVSPGTDRTIYVVQGSIGNQNIFALAPNSNVVARTIGPFTNFYISAMAVDSQGELYVALNPNNTGASVVRVYPSDASGKSPALRIINPTPTQNYIRGLAIYE